MGDERPYDILVIGSGPAGQKAAIQAAKAGFRAAVVERDRGLGGACIYRGTIPSKTLRESALQLARFDRGTAAFRLSIEPQARLASLMARLETVVAAYGRMITDQLERNGVVCIHGRARFVDASTIEVTAPSGERRIVPAERIIVATGSRPRELPGIPLDHEHIRDSDSILAMSWLPESLTVLGGGVIACEYASIFSSLGVAVTMIDRHPAPLGFLDDDLSARFVRSFEAFGGRWIGDAQIGEVGWDGVAATYVTLEDGRRIEAQKMLVALGRVANVEGLEIDNAGLAPNERGLLDVDARYCTSNPRVYAVGDVIGSPSLASTAMEQGRRAAWHALGVDPGSTWELIPSGIYSIPEIATVGLSEREALRAHPAVAIGRADFAEVARGQISGSTDGMLKLVADPANRKLLGAAIVGEGATELIHIAQMGLLAGCAVDLFVEKVFNFPTLAEAYRIAALDLIGRQRKVPRATTTVCD